MMIQTFTGGAFGENGFLVRCEATGEAVVVDPGASAPRMAAALAESGATLKAILLTHAHLDHVEGVPRILEERAVPIYLHEADLPLYRAVPQQAASFGVSVPELPDPEHGLSHGDRYVLGEHTLQVRHAPGHAPGHVIFWEEEVGVALTGDVVFRGSIGRTDLPGGDYRELMASIREQILTLPDGTRLYTGHGPETTVRDERSGNPFLVPQYGADFA